MKKSIYSAIIIFGSALFLSACQTMPQLVAANQQAPIVAPVVPAILDSDGDGVPDDIDQCPATPWNVVIDERGCPLAPIGVGLRMEYRAFFDKDSSELLPKYRSSWYFCKSSLLSLSKKARYSILRHTPIGAKGQTLSSMTTFYGVARHWSMSS